MTEYQQRVVDEKTELDKKRAKLSAFFGTELFGGLDKEEKHLLRTQYDVMGLYSSILQYRIAAFQSAGDPVEGVPDYLT